MQQKRQADEEEHQTDIRLNILVDATPDATMKIIIDLILFYVFSRSLNISTGNKIVVFKIFQ